jgi:pyruvate/2-oxoglutarate dehydrogenase complex dihydrolipoamide dehydrogenase (E3) component
MAAETWKNLIIGSGEGGKYLAWHLASSGQPAIVVERRWIGGSCPNVNCMPSKNEIRSAEVAHLVHEAGSFGTRVGSATTDMAVVRKRKREMVDGMIAVHLEKYKASSAQLVMGEAKFTGPLTLEVRLNAGGTRTLSGERIFLNLGTHASIPPVPGLADSRPLTNIEALELDRLPEHLIVIGGGYVGLEFAQAYRRFGSRVTIVQHGPQLLAREDRDVAAEIVRMLTDEGVDVLAPTEITGVRGRSGSSVSVALRQGGQERTIQGSDLLVATGRTPHTAGIGLELAGVELDKRGYIKVNERLATTAPNVWAIGECAGSPQFTHASLDDFRVIRDNLAGKNRTTRDRLMPSCLFTDPQVAHVGLSETEAQRRGVPFRLAKIPMLAVLRARTTGQTRGFMKALIGTDDRILGFTMIGSDAGEVISVVQTAMLTGQPYTFLREAILVHPTMGEGLNVLFSSVKPTGA